MLLTLAGEVAGPATGTRAGARGGGPHRKPGQRLCTSNACPRPGSRRATHAQHPGGSPPSTCCHNRMVAMATRAEGVDQGSRRHTCPTREEHWLAHSPHGQSPPSLPHVRGAPTPPHPHPRARAHARTLDTVAMTRKVQRPTDAAPQTPAPAPAPAPPPTGAAVAPGLGERVPGTSIVTLPKCVPPSPATWLSGPKRRNTFQRPWETAAAPEPPAPAARYSVPPTHRH